MRHVLVIASTDADAALAASALEASSTAHFAAAAIVAPSSRAAAWRYGPWQILASDPNPPSRDENAAAVAVQRLLRAAPAGARLEVAWLAPSDAPTDSEARAAYGAGSRLAQRGLACRCTLVQRAATGAAATAVGADGAGTTAWAHLLRANRLWLAPAADDARAALVALFGGACHWGGALQLPGRAAAAAAACGSRRRPTARRRAATAAAAARARKRRRRRVRSWRLCGRSPPPRSPPTCGCRTRGGCAGAAAPPAPRSTRGRARRRR